MNYLVDTHYIIWSLLDPEKIRQEHRQVLTDSDSAKFVSSISFWEISLKYSLGKLDLVGVSPEEMLTAACKAGFHLLESDGEDMASAYRLPFVEAHKDPFDRLLIWQCIRNNMTLITADSAIKAYTAFGLKLA
ncbi:type II toxin-antitoxin system VapC family toxin [Desulfonatronum lacustre]|uniref:type II toxin-antitoxin system VapC family toxin n=1 Tax=Desulfonatronum lacustre TaxID=66849 RepID=UPI000490812D|nr:type II toxin-antitoxin system VapC family toxin [Desulfonatronum lacustre]SMP44874.1 PIN domain nuclease, a component of toxin-antitoxin system (PIN domain) [Desulfonatronum zhilinae]